MRDGRNEGRKCKRDDGKKEREKHEKVKKKCSEKGKA